MKVGQKVVCLKTDWSCNRNNIQYIIIHPIKGEIYTIARTENDNWFDSGVGLVLAELKADQAYDSKWFRPIENSFGEQVAKKLEVFFVPLEAAYKEQNFGE